MQSQYHFSVLRSPFESTDIVYSKIYVFLILLIIISTGGGSAYAVLTGDAGTGLSIASYVLTVLALVLALVAAGDWLGLKKPDSFAFAYDVEDNIVLGETSANDRAQT